VVQDLPARDRKLLRNLVPFSRCRVCGPRPFSGGGPEPVEYITYQERYGAAIPRRAFIHRNLDGPDSAIIWTYDPKLISAVRIVSVRGESGSGRIFQTQ
jgi:hypothetical protein